MRYFMFGALLLLPFMLPLTPALGVLIGTGVGTGNTTAPADDPGFANVGICASGSAIYLGDGWALTAAHVWNNPSGSPTQAWFNGAFYGIVPGSQVQLANPTGVAFTKYSDLEMFRLATSPALPSLRVSSQPAAVGWQVTMIGNGRDRTNNQLEYWTPSWQPSTVPTPLAGDTWGSMPDIRWGTNIISGPPLPAGVDANSEMAFTTAFDLNGTTYEAQGTPGDSGGAVFHENPLSGQWALSGVMFQVALLPGQPWGTSIFGDSTQSADLSYYRTEIFQTMALPGDVNFDGIVNSQDLALVTSNWLKQGTGANDPAGDANHDGIVNSQDLALIDSILYSNKDGGALVARVPEPPASMLALVAICLSLVLAAKRHALSRPDGLYNSFIDGFGP
jgi:hypothetical protein